MSKYQFTVEVKPRFLADHSAPEDDVFSFSYTVTIANSGAVAAQLISRHWVISDASGHTDEVKGLGVIGKQPLLQPGEAFQYTSGCRLRTASGTMHGSFFCVAEDGERFEAAATLFLLEADHASGEDDDANGFAGGGPSGGRRPTGRVLH